MIKEKMKKRASYKVFGIITTILVISVLSVALLGNVGQGQETQSSDPVFIVWSGWFSHNIITIPEGTSIVVLNALNHSVNISSRSEYSEILRKDVPIKTEIPGLGYYKSTPGDHTVLYTPDYREARGSRVKIFVT